MPGGGRTRRGGIFSIRAHKRTCKRDEGLAAGKVGGIPIGNNLMDLLDLCDTGVMVPLDPRAIFLEKRRTKDSCESHLSRLTFYDEDKLLEKSCMSEINVSIGTDRM